MSDHLFEYFLTAEINSLSYQLNMDYISNVNRKETIDEIQRLTATRERVRIGFRDAAIYPGTEETD